MTDRNLVTLSGRLESTSARTIGTQGRPLVEARLRVSKPVRRGETEAHEIIPITVWDGALGAALLEMAPGTPCVMLGRVSAREWTSPSGQAKTFLEVVGESVTVDATLAAPGEPAAPPVSRPVAKPVAAPVRPSVARTSPREQSDVPF